MAKISNRNDLEQIYQRLDQLTCFIKNNFDELEDINEIRVIVEDLRVNLLKTIDERVEYIIGKQRDIYELRFDQLEEKIKGISRVNVINIKVIKEQLLFDISNLRDDLLRTDSKIKKHLGDKIKWKELILPAVVSGVIAIIMVLIVGFLDYYFQCGFMEFLDKLKP